MAGLVPGIHVFVRYTSDKFICHTDIQDIVGPMGQNVLRDVDGRDKPGYDEM